MQPSGKTEVQHYVPKFLLRPHAHNQPCDRGKEQVWCYDKQLSRSFSPNLKGVASGNRFYELDIEDETLNLEPIVTELENQAAPLFQEIMKNKSVRSLRYKDREVIATFFAVQLVRTQAARDEFHSLMDGLSSALKRRGFSASQVSDLTGLTQIEKKLISMKSIVDAPRDYTKDFLDKHWYLLASSKDDPFYVGDNPLVRDNDSFKEKRGNIGIRSPGVTIYLPLSPTICFCMTDKELVKDLFRDIAHARSLYLKTARILKKSKFHSRADLGELEHLPDVDPGKIYRETKEIFKGGLMPYDASNTMRVNSLQVIFASRWIMSSKKDFSLADEIVTDDDRLRLPPAYRFA